MIPELAYQADGYLKYCTKKGEKVYLAVLRSNGRARPSRLMFRTASAADAYGDRLVGRVRRMAANWTGEWGVTEGQVIGGQVRDLPLQEVMG